jgi:hypothetical protein
MILLENIRLLYCLNDTGVDKAYELLNNLITNHEYLQITPEQLKQQYENDLKIIANQLIPTKHLDLLFAIKYLYRSNSMMLSNVYSWGYIQGKRDERARRKKVIKDGINIPSATLKQIINNRIKYINDLETLQGIYEYLNVKEGVKA